ncbi:MAG: 16S rRNA (cytidine(1402)-2'-O)-methyltransferase [Candidatus Moranbacteria bacterium]|nr:16S rRNA (cytidine(1402)-2'-O)-methyltransferase [Candidatus Moranbacteria bacterium]
MQDSKELEFSIVATPIGNLEDITYRAVKTLKEADFILCEDTRKTKVLLDRYEISKPLKAYHQQTNDSKIERILEQMSEVKKVALVTDAGTPGISDPGNILIKKALEFFGDKIKITPIPGANALSALLSVAGINTTRFTFMGFPPNKKGREKFFREVLVSDYPVIYYESPYRLMKNLELIEGLQEELEVSKKLVLGRELTKMFEEIKRGEVADIKKYYEENSDKIKGEVVVLVY